MHWIRVMILVVGVILLFNVATVIIEVWAVRWGGCHPNGIIERTLNLQCIAWDRESGQWREYGNFGLGRTDIQQWFEEVEKDRGEQ